MKREKKESVNRVVYFKNTPPKSAKFIVLISESVINLIERHEGENDKIHISFDSSSLEPNNIYNTLKECHNIIGSKETLYAQMPEWMRYEYPLTPVTEIL